MKRLLFLLIPSLLLLAGCGGYIGSLNLGLNKENIDLGIDPNPLGFDADRDPETGVVTFTIPSHTLILSSKAGALGATVEGYNIEYYDSSGNPLQIGDHVVQSSGSLNLYVPPGLNCDAPDPVRGCRSASEGVYFARGPEAVSPVSFFLPVTIASEDFDLLFRGGDVGAYADFFLYGTNDLGNAFRTDAYQIAIQVPLGGG